MNFIVLSTFHAKGDKYYINPQNINAIHQGEGYTKIYAGGDDAFTVLESAEEIFQIIAEVVEEEKVLIHRGLKSNHKAISVIEK